MISWVLFDVGETLLHPAPDFASAFAQVCAREGVDCELDVVTAAAAAAWAHRPGATANGYSFTPEASRAFWGGLYAQLLEQLGVPGGRFPALIDRLYRHFSSPSSYELFPDARSCLERCRAAGLGLGVVSNFEAWLTEALDVWGVLRHFDVLAISGVEGIEKPDPALFTLALERTGSPAAAVGYVGDSPEDDIAPARGLGLRAVLLDRRNRHPDHDGPRITSLGEVPACLGP